VICDVLRLDVEVEEVLLAGDDGARHVVQLSVP
jgi:hypothetical protein